MLTPPCYCGKPTLFSGFSATEDSANINCVEVRCTSCSKYENVPLRVWDSGESLFIDGKLHTAARVCPGCGRKMSLRRNTHTGGFFWGCTGYPTLCSRTENISIFLSNVAKAKYNALHDVTRLHGLTTPTVEKEKEMPRAMSTDPKVIRIPDMVSVKYGILFGHDAQGIPFWVRPVGSYEDGQAITALEQLGSIIGGVTGDYVVSRKAYGWPTEEAARAVLDRMLLIYNTPGLYNMVFDPNNKRDRLSELFAELKAPPPPPPPAPPEIPPSSIQQKGREMSSNNDSKEDNKTMAADAHPPKKEKASRKDKLIQQGKRAGSATALGASLAATGAASDIFVDMARDLFEDNPMFLAMLENPTGRELTKYATALLVQGTAMQFGEAMPGHEIAARLAELQITESTRALAAPRLAMFRKYFAKLEEAGKMLPQLAANKADADDEDDDADPAEEARVRNHAARA